MACWILVTAWSVHLRVARRGVLRARLDIGGSAAADCAAATMLGPCALAQEAREIKYNLVPGLEAPRQQPVAEAIPEAVVVSSDGGEAATAGKRAKEKGVEPGKAVVTQMMGKAVVTQ